MRRQGQERSYRVLLAASLPLPASPESHILPEDNGPWVRELSSFVPAFIHSAVSPFLGKSYVLDLVLGSRNVKNKNDMVPFLRVPGVHSLRD